MPCWCVCIKAMKQALSSPSYRGREDVRNLPKGHAASQQQSQEANWGRQAAGHTLNWFHHNESPQAMGPAATCCLLCPFPACRAPIHTGCSGPKAARAGVTAVTSACTAAAGGLCLPEGRHLFLSHLSSCVSSGIPQRACFPNVYQSATRASRGSLCVYGPTHSPPHLETWGLLKQAVPAPPLSCDILRTRVSSLPSP